MRRAFLSVLLILAAATPASGQDDPSRGTLIPPRPVARADDPVNRYILRNTADGLVVTVRIDGAELSLERALPARVPRARRPRRLAGDRITVTAFAGDRALGSVTVPDRTVSALEHGGLIRQERRTLSIAVPAPGRVDAVEVRVSANGASRRFDVREAYAPLCRAAPTSPLCRGRGGYR